MHERTACRNQALRMAQTCKSRFQAKQHRRERRQIFVRDAPRCLHPAAEIAQHRLVVRDIVATQLRQRCTLTHTGARALRGIYQPNVARGVDAPRSARRLLEMQCFFFDSDIHCLTAFLDIFGNPVYAFRGTPCRLLAPHRGNNRA